MCRFHLMSYSPDIRLIRAHGRGYYDTSFSGQPNYPIYEEKVKLVYTYFSPLESRKIVKSGMKMVSKIHQKMKKYKCHLIKFSIPCQIVVAATTTTPVLYPRSTAPTNKSLLLS